MNHVQIFLNHRLQDDSHKCRLENGRENPVGVLTFLNINQIAQLYTHIIFIFKKNNLQIYQSNGSAVCFEVFVMNSIRNVYSSGFLL